MKTLSAITTRLTLALALQQLLYAIYYSKWIDFTEWSSTTLFFESLFILSIVFSSIVDAQRTAVGPSKSRSTAIADEDNTYTEKI
jgi:hypothetical protein